MPAAIKRTGTRKPIANPFRATEKRKTPSNKEIGTSCEGGRSLKSAPSRSCNHCNAVRKKKNPPSVQFTQDKKVDP